ncbi:MAG TPA: copper amine oxidase N-terminal domain-containing protein [Clostridia bacterium]|nr:copper amine oxidase N-terminal domain-containing protein [Clostridia bacterium]
MNRQLRIVALTVLIGLLFVLAAAQTVTAMPSMGSDYSKPECASCHYEGGPAPAPKKEAPKQEAPKQEAPKQQAAPQQQTSSAPKAAAPAAKAPAYKKVSLAVNNSNIEVVIINNHSLLSARELGNILGAEVAWDGEAKAITFTAGEKSVTVYLDKQEAKVNGSDAKAPVKAQSIDGSNMVPVRFVAEALGFTVHYTGQAISIYQ